MGAQRPLRRVQKERSGAAELLHLPQLAQYDDIVHIILGDIFPIPMRKVKGNSGSPPSARGGRKRVAEGASGPDSDPVLAFNTLFTESERGSANLRTEGSADGHNYVWCSPRSPYHNCAVRTIPVENPLSTPDGHSLRNMRKNSSSGGKIRDATTTSSRARAAPGRPHSAPENSWRDSPRRIIPGRIWGRGIAETRFRPEISRFWSS